MAVRFRVLQWVHTAHFSCHPGVNRTTAILQRYFWWPTIKDSREYVTACITCAQYKNSSQHPSGHLQPLTTPGRPWSHIFLDFVTGVLQSAGNTTILTIVDRFNKAANSLRGAALKLPTALETAQLLTTHVFRLHGIPEDIVLDWGPQFMLRVWKSFALP